MKVAIIENKTNIVVASDTIFLQGENFQPTDADYFSEAWRNAVDDGLVDADRRADYTICRIPD